MKRHIFVLFFIFAAFWGLKATVPSNLKNETLNYKVMYRWGLIHKQAGTARLSITTHGAHYNTLLTARSDPWADRYYRLRDTLSGTITRKGFIPQKYENIAHEDGDYKHDVITYRHSGNNASATCIRKVKKKKDTQLTTKTTHLEVSGVALDMLSMYYYMRYLDYDKMSKGTTTKLHIFSGSKKELLTIVFDGKETIKYDNKTHNTYHIKFTFTTDSGKETSSPMEAWISADEARIPLKLEGKLKVGKVQCLYTGH